MNIEKNLLNGLLEWAWGVIAKAGSTLGNWDTCDPEWKVRIVYSQRFFSHSKEGSSQYKIIAVEEPLSDH